jgi:hypothetical protein
MSLRSAVQEKVKFIVAIRNLSERLHRYTCGGAFCLFSDVRCLGYGLAPGVTKAGTFALPGVTKVGTFAALDPVSACGAQAGLAAEDSRRSGHPGRTRRSEVSSQRSGHFFAGGELIGRRTQYQPGLESLRKVLELLTLALGESARFRTERW